MTAWSGLNPNTSRSMGASPRAPCSGEAAGKSPVDRGKQGTKRSLLSDGTGIPLGCVVAPANRHASVFLRSTLEKLARFETRIAVGLPQDITVHLDAGFDSIKTRDLLDELGCDTEISSKGFPLQAGRHWVIERTNSWHNRGFGKVAICTEQRTRVIDAFVALANAVIVLRRLLPEAWTTHRWDTRPGRRPRPIRAISKSGSTRETATATATLRPVSAPWRMGQAGLGIGLPLRGGRCSRRPSPSSPRRHRPAPTGTHDRTGGPV